MLERFIELRRVSDILYDIQEVRKATANRLRTLPKETYGIYPETLMKLEERLTERLEELLDGIPVWDNYLKHVPGVGPRIAAAIIGRIEVTYRLVDKKEFENASEVQKKYSVEREDGILIPVRRGIEAFPNVSKFWKYFGLHVENGRAPRRERGKKMSVNEFLKMMVLGRLVTSFIRTGARTECEYEKLYRKMKEEYRAKYAIALKDYTLCPRWKECKELLEKKAKRVGRKEKRPPCLKHIDSMARRYVAKEFVKDLWINWRKIEGLPVTPPYIERIKPKGS